eukprot:g3577.t1
MVSHGRDAVVATLYSTLLTCLPNRRDVPSVHEITPHPSRVVGLPFEGCGSERIATIACLLTWIARASLKKKSHDDPEAQERPMSIMEAASACALSFPFATGAHADTDPSAMLASVLGGDDNSTTAAVAIGVASTVTSSLTSLIGFGEDPKRKEEVGVVATTASENPHHPAAQAVDKLLRAISERLVSRTLPTLLQALCRVLSTCREARKAAEEWSLASDLRCGHLLAAIVHRPTDAVKSTSECKKGGGRVLDRHVQLAATFWASEALRILCECNNGTNDGWYRALISSSITRSRSGERRAKSSLFRSRSVVECVLKRLARCAYESPNDASMADAASLPMLGLVPLLVTTLLTHRDTSSADLVCVPLWIPLMRCEYLLGCERILDGVALLLRFGTSRASSAKVIRRTGFEDGIVLHHLYSALFDPSASERRRGRILCAMWFGTDPVDEDDDEDVAVPPLLTRVLPPAMVARYYATRRGDAEEKKDTFESSPDRCALYQKLEFLRARYGKDCRAWRRIDANVTSLCFRGVARDHASAELIWNNEMRLELRSALRSELDALDACRTLHARKASKLGLCWNFQEFRVSYDAILKDELQIGGHFVRYLLLDDDSRGSETQKIQDPKRFFDALYVRLLRASAAVLSATSSAMKELCVEAMTVLYERDGVARIGRFDDILYVVEMMAQPRTSRRLRDRLLILLDALSKQSDNADALIAEVQRSESSSFALASTKDAVADTTTTSATITGSIVISTLIDVVTLAHATPNAYDDLVSDAGKSEEDEEDGSTRSTRCWWYLVSRDAIDVEGKTTNPVVADTETPPVAPKGYVSAGPLTFEELRRTIAAHSATETLVWASGQGGGRWTDARTLPQTRWCASMPSATSLDAAGEDGATPAVLSHAQAAVVALKIMQRMVRHHRSTTDGRGSVVRPIPIVKRVLGAAPALEHLAQALIFPLGQVSCTAAELLCDLLEHNEDAMRRLYGTGAFFFCLSTRSASNIRPIARLLAATHLSQHDRSASSGAIGYDIDEDDA